MRTLKDELLSLYPELTIRQKYDVAELILKRGKLTLYAVIDDLDSTPYVFLVPSISATIVDDDIVLSASFWKNIRKLFAKHGDMILSYTYEPYKHYPLISNLENICKFFDGKLFEWFLKDFKMPRRVADLWLRELSSI